MAGVIANSGSGTGNIRHPERKGFPMNRLTRVVLLAVLAIGLSADVAAAQGTADLSITKTAEQKTVKIGETITYTIMLTNLGPDVATDVVFGDQSGSAELGFVNVRKCLRLLYGRESCESGQRHAHGGRDADREPGPQRAARHELCLHRGVEFDGPECSQRRCLCDGSDSAETTASLTPRADPHAAECPARRSLRGNPRQESTRSSSVVEGRRGGSVTESSAARPGCVWEARPGFLSLRGVSGRVVRSGTRASARAAARRRRGGASAASAGRCRVRWASCASGEEPRR